MSPVVLNIPDVLLAVLYSAWLTIEDVAQLDSALCNSKQRVAFQNTIYDTGLTLQYPTEVPDGEQRDCMSVWICRKNAAMRGLYLTPTLICDRTLRETYLQSHGRSLEWIIYEGDEDEKLVLDPCEQSLGVDAFCPNLKCLRLTNWDGTINATAIVTACQSLTELHLEGNIVNNYILPLVGKCDHLKKLTINGIVSRPDGVLRYTALLNQQVEELNFNMRGFLCNTVVIKIQQLCPNLTALSLSTTSMSMAVLGDLLHARHTLRSLTLSDVRLFDNSTLAELASHSSSLRELHLDDVTLSNEAMLYLLQASRALHSLTLQDIRVHESVFMQIGPLCSQLQRLSIGHCAATVDDAVLLSLSQHSTQLRVLDVAGSVMFTDTGICAVVQVCPLLEEIHLPRSGRVTDASLLAVARHCRGLKSLTVAHNQHITDAGAMAVLQGSAKLLRLNLHHCTRLSIEMVAGLAKRMRRVRYQV